MQKKRDILFDLDGTLTDPMLGITKSVRYALEHFGIEVPSLEVLIPFIGPPFKASFQKYYGFSPEKADAAILKSREYFSETGMYENQVYDGIPEMLAQLKQQNNRLYLATSKPEPFAIKILEYFGLSQYFDFVGGALLSGERVEKLDVIEYVLTQNKIERENAIMVGDRCFDVAAGREAGLLTIGVLYGYGDEKELTDAGAHMIAKTVEELKSFLID